MEESVRKRLIKEAIQAYRIIIECYVNYHEGKEFMFKPIAGQLRILLCDSSRGSDNSLLHHLYPDLKLAAFKKHQYVSGDEYEIKGTRSRLKFADGSGNDITDKFKVAESIYKIKKLSNNVVTAELDLSNPPEYLSLEEWRSQILDEMLNLSVNDVIRNVSDKAGGAHIDVRESDKLKRMKANTPVSTGAHIYLIVALAGYALKVGEGMIAEWLHQYPEMNEEISDYLQ